MSHPPLRGVSTNTLGPRIGNQAVRRLQYPSPFFDLSSTYLPKNIKDLFRYCEYYWLTNPLINTVIAKMSEYPITDIILDMDSKEMKKRWEILIREHISLRKFLVEAGLDYYTYGNCYVSISYPFQKILTCEACGAKVTAERHMDSWKFHNFKFEFKKCPKCGSKSRAKANDVYLVNIPKIRLIRWDPKRILVMHSSTTGHSFYFYMMPRYHANDLHLGRKHVVVKTPQKFILAAKKNKPLKFHEGELYHLKRPMASGHSSGYGMPLMLPVLKDSFFLQILKKSQEAVAVEHVIPLRIIFPQSANPTANVMGQVALKQWREQIWNEMHRWKQDQNYMPIVPYPIGFQSIGGDGKALMLSQEIGVWAEQIVAGMGVPRELVFGGMSYSASNVSLRMLENTFLGYRNDQMKLVNWIIHKLSIFLGWEQPRARMKDFKMADDLQRKMYLMQLNQQGKVSDATLLSESDLDQDKENEIIESEMNTRLASLKKQQIASAEIAGEASLAQASYGVRLQELTNKLQREAQARLMNEQQEQSIDSAQSMLMGQSPLSLQKANPEMAFPQPVMDLRQVPIAIAEKMKGMDPSDAQDWMNGLQQRFPEIAQMVKQQQEVGMGSSAMKPLPEKLPPRREAASI